MDPADKARAEAVLRHVCLGRHVCGINFYATPVLVLDVRQPPLRGEAYLTIESRWALVDAHAAGDIDQADVPEQPIEELARYACLLREFPITGARLGETAPHLVLTFENGQALFVNGHHDRYESWNLYADDYMVIAVPGDGVAYLAPDGFFA